MQRSSSQTPSKVCLIVLLLVVYVYDTNGDTFKQLPDMPSGIPHQILTAKQALQSIDQGHSFVLLTGLTYYIHYHESAAYTRLQYA